MAWRGTLTGEAFYDGWRWFLPEESNKHSAETAYLKTLRIHSCVVANVKANKGIEILCPSLKSSEMCFGTWIGITE